MNNHQGYITVYDPLKGIGFIRRDKGKDVFLHYSNLDSPEESIIPGAVVAFELVDTAKGPRAEKIQVIGSLD
ncbi:retron Se72 family effector protein [Vibrio vulnificus]|uniref:retron Se72 family effector protein n=1 Tax=Vibrio vulnificus TaxID=672 RepID=UPI001CDC83A5|nr:retron Se72 family effector protein [Vibrio vulnificus]EIO4059265.1 retron Se72 family effector protein [Vibrio vulnificus]MCA3900312.1 retron Se72 family effector protein [Vibrio vulnificus]|tara:strand:+ start:12405 stop:12620 length:216 start_codon:yes stop_codon:yes gene_type:complete